MPGPAYPRPCLSVISQTSQTSISWRNELKDEIESQAKTHLRTFLANMSRDSADCVQRYSRRHSGGKGHDYFWSGNKAIQRMVLDDETFDQAAGVCGSVTKADERIVN